MLKTTKSITMSGSSMATGQGDGMPAMYFNAAIDAADGRMNMSSTVNDVALYEANKAQCRADEDEFKALVRAEEDAMGIGGAK